MLFGPLGEVNYDKSFDDPVSNETNQGHRLSIKFGRDENIIDLFYDETDDGDALIHQSLRKDGTFTVHVSAGRVSDPNGKYTTVPASKNVGPKFIEKVLGRSLSGKLKAQLPKPTL